MGKQLKRKLIRRKNTANKVKQRKLVEANMVVLKKMKELCSKSIQ